MVRPTRPSSRFVLALVAFTLVAASCGVFGSDDTAPTGAGDSPASTAVGDAADPAVDGNEGADPVPEPTEDPARDPAPTDPAPTDSGIQSPSMGPDEAVACAAVEFGYIGLQRGGSDADADLVRGAEAAMDLGSGPYEQAGQALLDSVGTDDAGPAADALLVLCAERGFERLA